MPEKRTDTADISFVIKAVIYWLLTAIPALLLASAALSLTNADGAKFAYASAAVSFIAAAAAGAAAAGAAAARTRGKGPLATGLLIGVVITTLLLMTGFIIAGSELAPDGILSVAAFTVSGAAAGSVLLRNVGRKRKKRPVRRKAAKLT